MIRKIKWRLPNILEWINSEKDLFQFAGNIFEYPLTKNQIENYLNDSKRFAFKVEFKNQIIGYSEIYLENNIKAKLCRIIIGKTDLRGKGIGEILTNELLKKSFEELNVEAVHLNVFDWNVGAIKCVV